MSRKNKNLYEEKWQRKAAIHPVYGVGPSDPTSCGNSEISEREFILGPRSRVFKIFPKTAVAASQSFQGNTNFPKAYYVDQLMSCTGCERHFIYFADEHRSRVVEKGKNFQAIPSHSKPLLRLSKITRRAKTSQKGFRQVALAS